MSALPSMNPTLIPTLAYFDHFPSSRLSRFQETQTHLSSVQKFLHFTDGWHDRFRLRHETLQMPCTPLNNMRWLQYVWSVFTTSKVYPPQFYLRDKSTLHKLIQQWLYYPRQLNCRPVQPKLGALHLGFSDDILPMTAKLSVWTSSPKAIR